jgi:hypothetical protein
MFSNLNRRPCHSCLSCAVRVHRGRNLAGCMIAPSALRSNSPPGVRTYIHLNSVLPDRVLHASYSSEPFRNPDDIILPPHGNLGLGK